MKTNKALTKRFKITKNGKVLRRPSDQNHYRSKKSGNQKRAGRGWIEMPKPLAKKIKQLIH